MALSRISDAFGFPSLCEGFGIPNLEPMDCGSPVVACRSPSVQELIGMAGEFGDPAGINDIAKILQKVSSTQN